MAAKKKKKTGRKSKRRAVNPFARQGSSKAQAKRARSAARGKRKLSAATKKKIGAASRRHWRSITGKGTPKSHIPLAQLKKNHARLGRTIAIREKSPAAWK